MFRDFLRGLPVNFLRVFAWPYTPWHALAIGLTAIFVLTGFDWWYFQHTRGSLMLSLTLPAAIIGWYVPIIGAVGMYVWGHVRKSATNIVAATAVTQRVSSATLFQSSTKYLPADNSRSFIRTSPP